MALSFLADWSLYTDYSAYKRNFSWPAPGPDGPLIYHCYWDREMYRHHELSIKSLLVTQSGRFSVWLWMPPGALAKKDPVRDRLLADRRLAVKEYVPAREAHGTPFQSATGLLAPPVPASVADGLRLLALWKHGGVYFDTDMLFLRDIRPLCVVEFFYQWSLFPFGNNALSHFRPGSANLEFLADRGRAIRSLNPSRLLHFGAIGGLAEVMVLPVFTFDPIWPAKDTGSKIAGHCNRFEEFFSSNARTAMKSFFPGSYAFHWHNQWTTHIRPRSIAGQLYRECDARWRTGLAEAVS